MADVLHALIKADASLFLWLNNALAKIPALQYLLGWPTYFGEYYFLIPLIALFAWIWEPKRWWRLTLLIAFVLLISGLLNYSLKHLILRPRPYGHFFPAFINDDVFINLYFGRPTSSSFPSGHVTAVTATGWALNKLYKNRFVWLYAAIPFIGFTRIFVGAHFPFDLLGGFFVGLTGAYLAFSLLKIPYLKSKLSSSGFQSFL